MKRRTGGASNSPFSDDDDNNKYAKASRYPRVCLRCLFPLQWLSVILILGTLAGLWKYVKVTTDSARAIHELNEQKNLEKIAGEAVFISSLQSFQKK
jgi:hypothetical protein